MKNNNQDKLNKVVPEEQPLYPSSGEASSVDKPFSFYEAPIYNLRPCKSITLRELYKLTIGEEFAQSTLDVHRDNSLKTVVLSYVTASGIHNLRRADCRVSFSGIICADFDHLEKYGIDVEDFKLTLAGDKVLNLSLINTSPSGTGVKAYSTIENAVAEEYNLYFECLYYYFLNTYGIEIDKACRDISRATFVNQDVTAIFTEGSIKREDLLALLPSAAENLKHCNAETPYVSTATSVPAFNTPTRTDEPRPSDLLNRDPRVHARAVAALKADGWVQVNEDLWRRPGKDGGCSAIYNFFDREGIYFFTNFSSSAMRFGRKGYTDVMIINELEFNSDWNTCIIQLAHEYL